jgi:hypothetical protein
MTGLLLIVAPWLFGFSDTGAAAWIPIILGVGLLGVSLVTRYELSVAKVIPMPTHLALDGALGIFLLISPWLFGFAEIIWWPRPRWHPGDRRRDVHRDEAVAGGAPGTRVSKFMPSRHL